MVYTVYSYPIRLFVGTYATVNHIARELELAVEPG